MGNAAPRERSAHSFSHAQIFHQHRHVLDRRAGGNKNQNIIWLKLLAQVRSSVRRKQITIAPAESQDVDPLVLEAARRGRTDKALRAEDDNPRGLYRDGILI